MRTGLRNLLAQTAFRLCLVVWSFGYLLSEIGGTFQGRGNLWTMWITDLPLFALGVAQSMIFALFLIRLQHRHVLVRAALLAFLVLLAGALQTLADFLLARILAFTIYPDWQAWALNMDPSRIVFIYILYTWTFSLVIALIWASRSNDLARMNEARARAFEAAASRAEAAALRLQLNPHFLFNTLNGIASLVVRSRKAEAEEMIGRLADFLRASLAADPMALIPLRQELTTVRSYLHVEQARLGDRMSLSYAVSDEALDVLVPNFLMQPLIENALKHGVGASRHGAIVKVGARVEDGNLVVSVINTALGRRPSIRLAAHAGEGRAHAGVGLANTRQRLHSLYGDRAWIRTTVLANGFECEIGLPAEFEVSIKAAAE